MLTFRCVGSGSRVPSGFQGNCQEPVRCVGSWIYLNRLSAVGTPRPFCSKVDQPSKLQGSGRAATPTTSTQPGTVLSLRPVFKLHRRTPRGRFPDIEGYASVLTGRRLGLFLGFRTAVFEIWSYSMVACVWVRPPSRFLPRPLKPGGSLNALNGVCFALSPVIHRFCERSQKKAPQTPCKPCGPVSLQEGRSKPGSAGALYLTPHRSRSSPEPPQWDPIYQHAGYTRSERYDPLPIVSVLRPPPDIRSSYSSTSRIRSDHSFQAWT